MGRIGVLAWSLLGLRLRAHADRWDCVVLCLCLRDGYSSGVTKTPLLASARRWCPFSLECDAAVAGSKVAAVIQGAYTIGIRKAAGRGCTVQVGGDAGSRGLAMPSRPFTMRFGDVEMTRIQGVVGSENSI